MDASLTPRERGAPASSLFLLVQIPLAMEMCSATFYTISSSCVPKFTFVHCRILNFIQCNTPASIKKLYEWFGQVIKLFVWNIFPGRWLFVSFSGSAVYSREPRSRYWGNETSITYALSLNLLDYFQVSQNLRLNYYDYIIITITQHMKILVE